MRSALIFFAVVHQHLNEAGVDDLAFLLGFAADKEVDWPAAAGLGRENVDEVRLRLQFRVLLDGLVGAIDLRVNTAHPPNDGSALRRREIRNRWTE